MAAIVNLMLYILPQFLRSCYIEIQQWKCTYYKKTQTLIKNSYRYYKNVIALPTVIQKKKFNQLTNKCHESILLIVKGI